MDSSSAPPRSNLERLAVRSLIWQGERSSAEAAAASLGSVDNERFQHWMIVRWLSLAVPSVHQTKGALYDYHHKDVCITRLANRSTERRWVLPVSGTVYRAGRKGTQGRDDRNALQRGF